MYKTQSQPAIERLMLSVKICPEIEEWVEKSRNIKQGECN